MPAEQFDGDVNVNGTVNTVHVSAQGNISALGNVNAGDTVNTKRVVLSEGLVHSVLQCQPGADNTVNAVTHLSAEGNISALGNVNAGDTVNTTHVSAQGNISALGNVNAGDTVNTTHVSAQGNISALGNVNAGNMNVTGDIRLENADCAEEFEVDTTCAQHVAPGTVMVLGEEGKLEQSQKAYDKRVAGVVSGAGNYKPGIVLDKQESSNTRQPIALLGKVFCKVDAGHGAIEIGDLLTTSPTPGHAMKATDPLKAFGAVIGKALRPLGEGQGLIPILIALQ
jgi:hypothetical protein